MNRTLRLTGLLVALVSANLLHASVSIGNSNVQIGGFFSQGYIDSSKNNYPFEAKGGTWDFREMGVNVSTTVGDHIRLGAQGFAQRLGNYGEDQVKLDWAVADYNFRPEIGIRAGRVKYPKGLYGEALDVDAIRPFIFLPSAVYSPVLRDFSSSFDGGMLYGTLTTKSLGSFDYKVFYGDIPVNTDQGVADFFTDASIFASPGVQAMSIDSVRGASLEWSTPVNGLKLHVSWSKITNAYGTGKFAAAPVLSALLRVDPTYLIVGAEYIRGDWTFAGEWYEQSGDTRVIALPAVNSTGKFGNHNYYVSVARRFGDKWELGTYFSHSKNGYPSATAPAASTKLDDWTASVRYNVSEHVILKAEFHSIDGRYNVFNTARTPNPAKADSMSFWAVKSTFIF